MIKNKVKGTPLRNLSNVSSGLTVYRPNAKQIVKGVNASNEKAKYKFIGKTDRNGVGSIYFDNLNPGSKYLMHVAATSPESF